jgi:TonB family protein
VKPQSFVELLATDPEVATDASRIDLKHEKQLVRSTETPEDQLANKPADARFLSEKTQRVQQEQQSRNTGMSANRSDDSGGENSIENKSSKNSRSKKLDFRPSKIVFPTPQSQSKLRLQANATESTSDPASKTTGNDDDVETRQKDIRRGEAHGEDHKQIPNREPYQSNPQQEAASTPQPRRTSVPMDLAARSFQGDPSTTGEKLPSDIKFGSLTTLNTDRYLYYSFYARAEELIRFRWVRYVRAVIFSYQNSHNHPGPEKWATVIEIVLDSSGNFQRAILHSGSGLKGLDMAPIQAFREAKQIPHPPQEMVKEDGTIRILYEFNVDFVAQYAADQ